MKTTDKTLIAIMKKNKEAIENGWELYIIFKGIINLKDFLKEWRSLDEREKLECYINIEDDEDWDDSVYNARNNPRIIGEHGDTLEEVCQEEIERYIDECVNIKDDLVKSLLTCYVDWQKYAHRWALDNHIGETIDPETGLTVYYYEYY